MSHLVDGGINNGFEEIYASNEEAATAMCILAESNFGGSSFASDIEKPLKVMGQMAKARLKTTKSLSSTSVMENTALTIFEGLQKVGGNGKVCYVGGVIWC